MSRETGQLTDADFVALAEFRLAVRRYLAFTEAGAQSVGLTSQQHQALLAIKAQTLKGPMSIGDLSVQLLIRHHSAAEMVGRLEKAGHIQRDGDLEDKRKVLLSLTERGEAVLAALSANNLRELRLATSALGGLIEAVGRLDAEP